MEQPVEAIRTIIASNGLVDPRLRPLATTGAGDVLVFRASGGDAAIDLWRRLRRGVPRTGHWPVLLGTARDADWHHDVIKRRRDSVAVVLQAAAELDAEEWFRERNRERLEDWAEDGVEPEDLEPPWGEWPKRAVPACTYAVPFESGTGRPLPSIEIGLVPITHPWEVPAYLSLGSRNECPPPDVHCCVMAYWNRKFGAEIVAATHDTIEMAVSRPPTDRDVAMALAMEQYIYCEDIVSQGTRTVSNLAASLLGGTAWFFWWD